MIINKVIVEEMGGIEYWGLNMVMLGEDMSWEVGKWCNEVNVKVSYCFLIYGRFMFLSRL